uniref:Disintegrin domain-containing protein n=1 Tax=Cyprinodon variegatus TaxID=28743 RepID=A0A3Q2CUU6_CYPVA
MTDLIPKINQTDESDLSSCSSSNYERYLTTRSPSCLLDKPDYMRIQAPAVCGNGFKEKGEQCDCGTVQECTNPCCNATTCTLSAGSQCAEGECCADCQIQPRSRECRPKQDDCDLAEYCDGKSATCPEDVFAVNGLPCNKGLGYCYNGQCPQRSTQCLKLYGNSRPLAFFLDFFCGKLFCSGGNPNPIYGQMVTIGGCKAAFIQDYTKDYGQVEEGTVCGEGKVCSQNQCMDVEAAYRNTNCSCQCTPGWLPPNCGAQDEAFNSLSTGKNRLWADLDLRLLLLRRSWSHFEPIPAGAKVAVSLAVILVVLGLIFGVVGFMCKKKKQAPSLPT